MTENDIATWKTRPPAALLAAYATDEPVPDIAARIRVSTTLVANYANRAGVRRPDL